MKTNTRQFGYIMVLAALTLVGCAEGNKANEDSGTHDIPVSLSMVSEKELALPVKGSGLISSETEANLSFKIGGILDKVYVEEGDRVRKGQLLARLDLTEINAKVVQAQNAQDKAQRDLERVKNLYAEDAATLEQVQDLTTLNEVTAQELRIAQFNRRYAEIRAISNGIVVRKMMNEGELLNPGTPVFFMNDTTADQWKLEMGVSDKDWARLKIGDQAIIEVDAYPDTLFKGEVIRLSQGADPANGSYTIEVSLRPNGKKFATGMFAKALIDPEKKHTYKIVPVEAIVNANGTEGYVFVMQGETKVKKLPVSIAFFDGDQVAISKGLEQVDQVVTAGTGFVNEYVTVKIQL